MLEKQRKNLEEIDEKMIELLNDRAKVSSEIGKIKRKAKKPVYDPVTEKKLINSLLKKNREPLSSKALESVFREIISFSRSLQKPLRIGFLGPETTFTHIAALRNFGSSNEMIAVSSIKNVFKEVEKNHLDFGVVPIENSTEGSVLSTLDMFLDLDLTIVSEVSLKVRHNLLSKNESTEVKKIFSHPQALEQCKIWIAANFPKAELIETGSTAKAAEKAALYLHSAAIASELAAKKFGLTVLEQGIQDISNNTTRFLVIAKKNKLQKSGCDKTSIVFSTTHKPGALYKVLESLQKHNINMTKIESRPSKKKQWEYVFFVDFEGFVEDGHIQKALNEMTGNCIFLKIIGCYPKAATNN